MSLFQFYRLKCRVCGSKFTITTNISCRKCDFLGIQCQHRTLCFKCYRQSLRDGLFYSTIIAIMSVTLYGLGGRMLIG